VLPCGFLALGIPIACGPLLGLDEYVVEEAASGGSPGSGGGAAGSPDGGGGTTSTGGAAGTGGKRDGSGGHMGGSGGDCSAEPCGPVECVDTAPGAQLDDGCDEAAPICDERGIPTCVQCLRAVDCDDGIECTVDRCEEGVCVSTPSDALCGTGTCQPELCDSDLGCLQELTLIDDTAMYGNGSFEHGAIDGNGQGPPPWTYNAAWNLVYDCAETDGCQGALGANLLTRASHGARVLWMAGVNDHVDDTSQHLTLPAGARVLRVRADTSLQTESATPTNEDVLEVWLLDAVGAPLQPTPLWRRTAEDASTDSSAWTTDGIDVDVDVSTLTSPEVRISFRSFTDDSSITDFFLDRIRVTTLVCQ
jgi:hypothetical protein